MDKIIGADELIYRIRKNDIAIECDNFDLGMKISNLIKSLGGSKHIPSQVPFWDTKHKGTTVNEFGLPKTSEQYLISYDMLPTIYRAIDSW